MPLNISTLICPSHNIPHNFNSKFQKNYYQMEKLLGQGLCFIYLCSFPLLFIVNPQEMSVNEWGKKSVFHLTAPLGSLSI